MKSFFLGFAIFFSGIVFAQSTFIQHPQISPDASQMAFSCYGDIFTYHFATQNLKRLTTHQAYESNPVWKADGGFLAFASNRKSNTNVFVIPSKGGVTKQLTYYPTSNIPTSWNGDNIIFTTKRVYAGPEWDAQTYVVNEKGETPQRLLKAYGSMASVSPNGKLIAFVKGACRVAREDYSGSAQRDVWIYNTETKQYHQITTSYKNDHSPSWDAESNLYYISAKSGRYNIYKQAVSSNGTATGNAEKLTNQKNDGVQYFSVSKNGTIVYAVGVDIYKLSNGKSKKVELSIPSDDKFENEITKTTGGGLRGYAISPNGKKTVFEVAGEIFVKENDKKKKRSNNVSNHPYRDKYPDFIDDKTVVFLSDRSGHFEIYKAYSEDAKVGIERSLKIKVEKLTNHKKEDIEDLILSPNKKKVAYQLGRGKLIIADILDGKITNEKVFSDSWSAPSGVSWSPDSKWIAYSQQDLDFDSEIFIQSIADKNKKINVSMHPRSDRSPKWSADGKKLAFISNRSGINYDVWMLWLKKEDWEKTRLDREEGDYYPEQKKEKKQEKDKKSKKKEITVKIDTDRIYDRLLQVTALQDDQYGAFFSPDSKFIYYSAISPATKKRSLYKVKWDGSSPKEIKGTAGAGAFTQSKGKIYFFSRGMLKSIDGKSDKVSMLPHTVSYTEYLDKERAQTFDEGIRALTAGFYDPEFHGYNWKALVKKYRPWVLSATTTQDYAYMYNLLLGQLNASHMGYRPSKKQEKVTNDKVGLLGLEVVNTSKGVRVNYVLPNSVADKSKSKLKVGDVITSLNGKKINEHTNFYSLLKHAQNKEVLLTLSSGKDVVIRPSVSLRTLQYEAWVQSRKDLVNKFSNGQLGYIHIRGMGLPSFERFERELKASGYGKKGIVVDVRYNGGGWTTDRLMAVLNVKQHAYTVPRGATKSLKNNKKFSGNYPFNERAILSVNTKPLVALCNENSYSNAEIFSHAFKTLELGKLVGQPTFGAVISTGGKGLTNGYIRMPFRAWYNKKTGENMENDAPAVPDYLVKNAPGSKDRGEDAQLKKAVEVLLNNIK